MVDNFIATFEDSSFNFTCADGFTTIIRTDCTAEGHWSPDPATYMCTNASDTIITAADMTTDTDREGIATDSEEAHNHLRCFL